MSAIAIRDAQHYLVSVREIRELAERLESVEDAKDLADRAAAAKVWAERARLGEEQVNLAAIAKLWAERRAGELLASTELHSGGRPAKTDVAPYAQNERVLYPHRGEDAGDRYLTACRGAQFMGWEEAAAQLEFEREQARQRRAA